jgi:hypothetical protein
MRLEGCALETQSECSGSPGWMGALDARGGEKPSERMSR